MDPDPKPPFGIAGCAPRPAPGPLRLTLCGDSRRGPERTCVLSGPLLPPHSTIICRLLFSRMSRCFSIPGNSFAFQFLHTSLTFPEGIRAQPFAVAHRERFAPSWDCSQTDFDRWKAVSSCERFRTPQLLDFTGAAAFFRAASDGCGIAGSKQTFRKTVSVVLAGNRVDCVQSYFYPVKSGAYRFVFGGVCAINSINLIFRFLYATLQPEVIGC